MRQHKIRPERFPEDWASAWGEDEYGLWMAFSYKGIKQVFRWIEPGRFMMGSPEHEPERFDSERQHQVTLRQGFWLADSTVTQALWEAVMGENPSDYKGNNRPVENVSWDDANSFISKVNTMKPELKLCLPTEAQWEYACRAGTSTPFSFGENITPEEVNYNGQCPYDGAEKGRYREETVDVKSLPANDWGLFEMHGNVWEWCQDFWQEQYPADSVIDPKGSETGDDRVLRGGSWFGYGRNVRSAYRSYLSPDVRRHNIGFRLARSH